MTPWVRRLLVANLVVYLLQLTVVTDLSLLGAFVFQPLLALTRPWTFVTYQFLHGGVLHLAFNLLALFIFGPAVEERLGSSRFIGYYLWCGVGGALLSFALMLVIPAHPMVGASGAIYGVMLAYAWFWPDASVFVFPFPEPIPAKWLVTLLFGLSLLFALFPGNDGVAHLAHLGGIAAGFAFLKVRAWRGGTAPQFEPPAAAVLVQPDARAARSSRSESPRKPPPADRSQAEINRVLDKISATGIESLTAAERRFLSEMSRRLRKED
jgi:membrane associated rhomboid family serine protease